MPGNLWLPGRNTLTVLTLTALTLTILTLSTLTILTLTALTTLILTGRTTLTMAQTRMYHQQQFHYHKNQSSASGRLSILIGLILCKVFDSVQSF